MFSAWPDLYPRYAPDAAMSQQVQIADCVEHLVLHELVTVAQSVLVQDPEVVDHYGVVDVAAESEIVGPQGAPGPG